MFLQTLLFSASKTLSQIYNKVQRVSVHQSATKHRQINKTTHYLLNSILFKSGLDMARFLLGNGRKWKNK